MNIQKAWMPIILLMASSYSVAQHTNAERDSIYIHQVQDYKKPDKVLHAEPLYIDLIRDLGARKGEKEWNIGLGLTDNLTFDSYEALVEYEWAPVNRLGLEVELPFIFYSAMRNPENDFIPAAQLNSIKVASQWSFFVNERLASSMAIGYIHEFKLSDFNNFKRPYKGNIFNPFLVVAKRWGNNFHSLLYTGPQIEKLLSEPELHVTYAINTSFHYMISGTRNFLGVEFNQALENSSLHTVIRPQMRVGIVNNIMIGIVTGIPVHRESERLSSFLRLIWEPGHKKVK